MELNGATRHPETFIKLISASERAITSFASMPFCVVEEGNYLYAMRCENPHETPAVLSWETES